MIKKILPNKLWRRLAPLYLSNFFLGFIFWYAIEKVFMTNIGFNAESISLIVVLMAVTGLLLEIPSGILADRWSRKGVLILSSLSLAICSLILGISDSFLVYAVGSIFFAIYVATESGTTDAIVYDTLLEENNSRKGYEKYLGYTNLFHSVALIFGSSVAGIISNEFGLNAAYLFSIPGAILASIILVFFKEPRLHKKEVNPKILTQTKLTFQAIFKSGYLGWILVALIGTGLVAEFLMELDQLWPLALALPLFWYGPLNALLLTGYGISGHLAHFIMRKQAILLASVFLSFIFISLLFVKNMPIIAVAQFGSISLFLALYVISLGKLHDNLPSNLRSSSSSAVGTIINILFIPSVLLFGFITESFSVFTANIVLVFLSVIGLTGILKISNVNKTRNNGSISNPALIATTSAKTT